MPFAGFRDAGTVRASPLPVELGPGPFSTTRARGLGVPPHRLGRGGEEERVLAWAMDATGIDKRF